MRVSGEGLGRLHSDDLVWTRGAALQTGDRVRLGGRLCCFSPCIEQVARAVEVLPALGFTRVEVLETLVKTHEVKAVPQHDPIAAIVAQAEAPPTACSVLTRSWAAPTSW